MRRPVRRTCSRAPAIEITRWRCCAAARPSFLSRKPSATLRERLIWRQNPQGTFDYSRDRGRWVRGVDRETSEGGMVSIRIDVTDLKRREAILSLVDTAAAQVLMGGGWHSQVEDLLARLGPVM